MSAPQICTIVERAEYKPFNFTRNGQLASIIDISRSLDKRPSTNRGPTRRKKLDFGRTIADNQSSSKTIAKSSSWHDVPMLFIRTKKGTVCLCNLATASRALILHDAATPSSRSRMMPSAPHPTALERRSSLSAGRKRGVQITMWLERSCVVYCSKPDGTKRPVVKIEDIAITCRDGCGERPSQDNFPSFKPLAIGMKSIC